jgi:hypothetical protein
MHTRNVFCGIACSPNVAPPQNAQCAYEIWQQSPRIAPCAYEMLEHFYLLVQKCKKPKKMQFCAPWRWLAELLKLRV